MAGLAAIVQYTVPQNCKPAASQEIEQGQSVFFRGFSLRLPGCRFLREGGDHDGLVGRLILEFAILPAWRSDPAHALSRVSFLISQERPARLPGDQMSESQA